MQLWGCSATVRRHDGVALGAVFDKAGMPGTLCISCAQVTFERSIVSMWAEGWLCGLRAIRVATTTDISRPSSSIAPVMTGPQMWR